MTSRAALVANVAELIARLSDGSRDDAARDRLLERVLDWQRARVEPYGRIVSSWEAEAGPSELSLLRAPAVPTDVFRFARVAAHSAELDVRMFRTSGTTAQGRGEHCLRDLSLYEKAAEAAARHALFPDLGRDGAMALCVLGPRDGVARDSSLSFMLDRFDRWFGRGQSIFAWRGDARSGELDVEALVTALARAQQSGEPLALLGTSFAFVHADDALGIKRFSLPTGSRLMQTGGFKGRSREVEPVAMRAMLRARYGLSDAQIVAEYGMTELSSQMYETTLRDALRGGEIGPRRLWVPGWMRATPVDPETLAGVPEGEVGILRIDDLANLDTASAIQTSDRARRVGDGIEVLGRAPGATPRGCSIAVDAALGG